MVYLKRITRNSSWSGTAITCLLLVCCAEASISKFNYKKPIFGKDKYQKHNLDLVKMSTASLPKTLATTSESLTTLDMESSTTGTTLTSREEKSPLDNDALEPTTALSNDILPGSSYTPTIASSSDITSPLATATTELLRATTIATTTGDNVKDLLPCTCGIFLSSQFIKGSQEPPKGEVVISNSLDRTFPCNGVGQKQCQTKCLEQIVQHLPNSANILCASLDRDIRKERAYLFIKNCEDRWINTNLAAGREYCCKNSKPYNCK